MAVCYVMGAHMPILASAVRTVLISLIQKIATRAVILLSVKAAYPVTILSAASSVLNVRIALVAWVWSERSFTF